jgi:hypothetical protein
MATEWYVRVGNAEHGPVSSETLKRLAAEDRVTSATLVRKGSSGNWVSADRVKGLFATTDGGAATPPMPQSRPPVPLGKQTVLPPLEKPVPIAAPSFVVNEHVVLGIGAACLAVLALSPLFHWVTVVVVGGIAGIRRDDGKIVLVISLFVGGFLGFEFGTTRRVFGSVILAQAWGTIAFLLMIGVIWGVETISTPFRSQLASSCIGLYLGLLAAMGTAIAFGILAAYSLKKPSRFAVIQTFSFLIGICLTVVIISDPDSLVGSLRRAGDAAREAARRMCCSNQLKQIGLAMHTYHQKYGCFPPAFIADKNGKPMHSWRVLLLPYLEWPTVYANYRFDEPWNGPHNIKLAELSPNFYRCTSEGDSNRSQTSYVMIVGPHAISDGPTPRHLSDIKDGPSNTIIVAETAQAGINWLEPRDLNTKDMVLDINDARKETSKSNMSSNHAGVVTVLMGDGSVRSLPSWLNAKTLEALMTIDGGEAVNLSEL